MFRSFFIPPDATGLLRLTNRRHGCKWYGYRMKLPSGRFLVITVLHSFTNKQKSWCVCVYTCCAPMNTFFPSNFACLYASKKLSSFLYFTLDTCLSSMSGWIVYVSFPFPGLVVLFFIAICSNWILSRSLSISRYSAALFPFLRESGS